jgi:hypothetical protein
MEVGSSVEQKAGSHAYHHTTDQQDWTVVGHEIEYGLHKNLSWLVPDFQPLPLLSNGCVENRIDASRIQVQPF